MACAGAFGTLTDRRQYTQAIAQPERVSRYSIKKNQEPREEAMQRDRRRSRTTTGTRYDGANGRNGMTGGRHRDSEQPFTMIDLAPLLLGRASFVGRWRVMLAELQRVIDLGPLAPGAVAIAMLHSIATSLPVIRGSRLPLGRGWVTQGGTSSSWLVRARPAGFCRNRRRFEGWIPKLCAVAAVESVENGDTGTRTVASDA